MTNIMDFDLNSLSSSEEETSNKKRKKVVEKKSKSKQDRIQRRVLHLTEEFRKAPTIQYSNILLNGGHSSSANPFLTWSIDISITLTQLEMPKPFQDFKVTYSIDNFPRFLPDRRENSEIGYITLESKIIKTNFYKDLESAVIDLTKIIENIHSDKTFFLTNIYYPYLDVFSDISDCQNCTESTAITRCDKCGSAYCLTCILRYCNKILRNGSTYYSIRNICACRSIFRVRMYSDIEHIYNDIKEWKTGNEVTNDIYINDNNEAEVI
jgi:hypothetical protein